MDYLKDKTVSGFLYKFAERGVTQFVSFFVQIVLARILMPEDFGTVALLTAFVAVLSVVVTYGYGNSLIVNKQAGDTDFSTCFYFGLFLASVIYYIVFALSGHISSLFFGKTGFEIFIKVFALRLPISAMLAVLNSYSAKNMQFSWLFYSKIAGTLCSGIIGISLALLGLGIWALIFQNLSELFLTTLVLFSITRWVPKRTFSFSRLKVIYDYGWKILGVGLIDTSYGQIRSYILAGHFSRSSLGHYNRGMSFPSFSSGFVEQTINSVLLPTLSNYNDVDIMKAVVRRTMKCSTFIMCSLMCILAAVAKPLVVILLTSKWLPCVVFIQIGCIAYFFRPIQIINSCVIRASGKSGLLLELDILKKSIGVMLLIVAMFFGVVAIAWSFALTNIISAIINIYPNKKILGYGYKEQFYDVANNAIIGFVVGLVVWGISFISMNTYLLLIIQVVVGLFFLLVISTSFKIDSYTYLKDILVCAIYKKTQNETV